ncbi:unnamed protein product [Chironomus riparius]|uniref:Ammonium transporter AmtB-like domain-containing protein n=1 Tax=Chironomus riparius TaxID=315576 RepID=A0A9N9WYV3_9DIPT|nr:unnamed protein product [Chironomus riparius]
MSNFTELFDETFKIFPRNDSYALPGLYELEVGDAAFPLCICLMIFQMQTGFALIESGIVRPKNSVNIMMKNIADVCIGGLAFYIFGFGLAFGRGPFTTPFFGSGDFFPNTKFGDPLTCQVFTLLLYQMSYATTSNTIVSGAVAERVHFSAYCILTFLITILYSLGAGWMWGEHGWLRNLGAVDLSGAVIHIVGGAAGVTCTWFLGPRIDRYKKGREPLPMGNPVFVCIGLFILWWGWIAFNCGCSYGITGGKWHYAARAGVGTALASWGAGTFGIAYSAFLHKGKIDVFEVISGIICALVMINASCYLMPSYLALITGAISAFVSISLLPVLDKFHIDDPIGVFAVHWFGGVWGHLTVGLFSENPVPLTTTAGKEGLLMGGDYYFFLIQCVSSLSLTLLGLLGAYPIIWLTNKIVPLRLDPQSELLGCDIVEHGIVSDPNTGTEKIEDVTNNEFVSTRIADNLDNMKQRKRFGTEMNLNTVSEHL